MLNFHKLIAQRREQELDLARADYQARCAAKRLSLGSAAENNRRGSAGSTERASDLQKLKEGPP
jgi:hypothetical protein